MSDDIWIFVALITFAWLWWDSRGTAERATTAARSYCSNAGVSFLNDTVFWKKIRLKRNRQGRVQFQRTYFFEFASDMQQRYRGVIVMLGDKVESIQLEAYRFS